MRTRSAGVVLAVATVWFTLANVQSCFQPAVVLAYVPAPGLKPAYLSEMPSVERVMREVKGSDADDTVARRLGALLQFNKMIEDMAWELERRYADALTGDEQRLRAEYMAAFKQLRATVPDRTFRALRGTTSIRTSPKCCSTNFSRQIFERFGRRVMPRKWRDWRRMRGRRTTSMARRKRMPEANSTAGGSSSGDMASSLKGIAKGLLKMGGLGASTGLLMNGNYKGEGFGVAFSAALATVHCGGLTFQERKYTVQRNGAQVVVTLENEPKAIMLALRADGKLAGQGPMTVSGEVQVGTKRVQAYDAANPAAYGTAVVAIYEQKSVRCTVGALVATGTAFTTGTAVNDAMSTFGMGSGATFKVTPGLRINGEFVGQGGSIEFDEDSAKIKCGQSASEHAYAVEPSGNQIVVKIDGGGTLEIAPGGQLVGQGGNGSCNLGTLALAGGAASNMVSTSAVSASSSAAAPASSNVAAAAPASPPAAGTSAVLALASGLPTPAGGKNALVGHTFGLSREDFATVLTKAGFHPPAGTSVVAGWLQACKSGSPLCRQGFNAMGAASIVTVSFDAAGKAVFPAEATGTYYVFGSTRYGNGHLLWDVRVELKPGGQTLTLTERNAMPVE